jgi:hypothetical protein
MVRKLASRDGASRSPGRSQVALAQAQHQRAPPRASSRERYPLGGGIRPSSGQARNHHPQDGQGDGNYSELPPKHHHGLGRRRRVGVKRSTGVRLWTGAGGNDVTTSGSWRVFSAWSIAVASAGGVDISIGGEKIRLASPPHTGHPIASGAVPSARATSNAPSWSHRYSYVAMNGGPLSS